MSYTVTFRYSTERICSGPIFLLKASLVKGTACAANPKGNRKRLCCLYAAKIGVQGFGFKVKATRANHGKKAFGPVLVDQLYG